MTEPALASPQDTLPPPPRLGPNTTPPPPQRSDRVTSPPTVLHLVRLGHPQLRGPFRIPDTNCPWGFTSYPRLGRPGPGAQ